MTDAPVALDIDAKEAARRLVTMAAFTYVQHWDVDYLRRVGKLLLWQQKRIDALEQEVASGGH